MTENGCMKKIELYFGADELLEVSFCDGTQSIPRISMRGKSGGPFRRAGSFQWTNAVKALALLMVRTALKPTEAVLRGDAHSLAASLDYAISKQPLWLLEMFGSDQRGACLIRRMVLRANPERKRPGPVTLGVNQLYLPLEAIRVFLNGRECTGDALVALAQRLGRLEQSESQRELDVQDMPCDIPAKIAV